MLRIKSIKFKLFLGEIYIDIITILRNIRRMTFWAFNLFVLFK